MAVAEKVTVELELRDQQYNARVRASEREFQRSMDATERAAADAARDIDRTMGGVPDSLKAKYRELGMDIGRSFAGISRAAGLAFGAITAYSLKLASDAGEIESAFQVAFGNSTDNVKAFSEQLADTAGRDSVVLRESMTRLQLVLTGTGVAASQAAELVKALSTAGVDAGSLFNTSDAEALQKIISGLTGEAEPLKAFGVVLTEAAVKAELLRLGFKGNVDAASEAAKSIARANLILKGLSVAQGDAARTADSAANTTKRMTAEFNKAARDLGTQLLPAMTQLFGAATNVLKAFNDLPGGVQVAGLAFLGLIAAGGPIVGLIANLARLRQIAIETRAALALTGGAGGIVPVGAGRGVLGTAALGAGLLTGLGSFNRGPEDMTAAQLEREIAGRQRSGVGSQQYTARLQAELARRRALEARNAEILAIGNGTGSSATDTVLGGFGLGDLANGTAKAGKKARGPSAETLANRAETDRRRREDDAASEALAIAQGRRDQDAIRALERQAEIRDRQRSIIDASTDAITTQATVQSALTEATARQVRIEAARAEGIRQTLATRRLENELSLAQISGNEEVARQKQRELELAQLILFYQENQLTLANATVEANADLVRLDEARAMAARRAMDDAAREDVLTVARILAQTRADEKRIKDLEDQEEIIRRIRSYMTTEGGGLSEADAIARATREVGNIRGAEDQAQYLERGQAIATSFLDVLRSDDIGAEIGNRFREAAFDNLQQALSTIFSSLLQGRSTGGIFGAIGSFLAPNAFGGGRAMGGPVRAGFAYDVGESGREKFVAPANGYIIPNMGATAKTVGSQRIDVRQTFVLEGVNGDQAIYANVQRLIAQGQRQTLAIVRDQAGNVQSEQRLLRD